MIRQKRFNVQVHTTVGTPECSSRDSGHNACCQSLINGGRSDLRNLAKVTDLEWHNSDDVPYLAPAQWTSWYSRQSSYLICLGTRNSECTTCQLQARDSLLECSNTVQISITYLLWTSCLSLQSLPLFFFTFYLYPSSPFFTFLYFTMSSLLSYKIFPILLVSLLLPARLGDTDIETSVTDIPTVLEYLWSTYSYFCVTVASKIGYSEYIIHVTDTCENLTSVPFYAVFLMTVK